MREYSSFDQIDRDLKILKLQTLINREEMKLSYGQTKHDLTPGALAGSLLISIGKNAIIAKAIAKLSGIKKVVFKK